MIEGSDMADEGMILRGSLKNHSVNNMMMIPSIAEIHDHAFCRTNPDKSMRENPMMSIGMALSYPYFVSISISKQSCRTNCFDHAMIKHEMLN